MSNIYYITCYYTDILCIATAKITDCISGIRSEILISTATDRSVIDIFNYRSFYLFICGI